MRKVIREESEQPAEELTEDLVSGEYARPKLLSGDGIEPRSRWLLDSSGNVHRALRVFCPREDQTCSADVCGSCEEYIGLSASGRVRCAAESKHTPRTGESITTLAARTLVGEAVQDVVCIMEDVPLARLDAVPSRDVVIVVDSALRPVGALSIGQILWRTPFGNRVAGDFVDPLVAMGEHESLGAVLVRMAHGKFRRLCVTDRDDSVVGVLSDVTCIHWLTGRLRGTG